MATRKKKCKKGLRRDGKCRKTKCNRPLTKKGYCPKGAGSSGGRRRTKRKSTKRRTRDSYLRTLARKIVRDPSLIGGDIRSISNYGRAA